MDLKAIEKMLRPTGSRFRPNIWKLIGSYTIEPPERFCPSDIYYKMSGHAGFSTIWTELVRLETNDMVLRLPPDNQYDRVSWYARTDQEAWDTAFEIMKRNTPNASD